MWARYREVGLAICYDGRDLSDDVGDEERREDHEDDCNPQFKHISVRGDLG